MNNKKREDSFINLKDAGPFGDKGMLAKEKKEFTEWYAFCLLDITKNQGK